MNYPKHYRSHASGIECVEIAERLGFNAGNAVKYLWRAEEKGYLKQDLEKSLWYVKRCRANRLCGTWTLHLHEKMAKFLAAETSQFRRQAIAAIYEATRAMSPELADGFWHTAAMLIEAEIKRLG